MSKLKLIMKGMKTEGYVVKPLEKFLRDNHEENDRAINVNSPSQASNCLRRNFYMRMGMKCDGAIDPRTQRIFDNGTHVHIRLQEYLLKCGILVMDEVPCIDTDYNIQGHTDGYLTLSPPSKSKGVTQYTNIAILEIKSINSHQFTQLKDAKPEHKEQAMVYLHCSEKRRKYLRSKYKNKMEFDLSRKERKKFFESRYTHLKGGSKYTKEEKLALQIRQNFMADKILFNTTRPITKVIFLYEDKNTQDLKEFVVEYDEELVNNVLERYETLNEYIKENEDVENIEDLSEDELPPREGTSKSCATCRWCPYTIECFC